MSPEDQRVWEEDAETEYAEAYAQARPATHGPADAEKVSQDVGEVERARVARYAEAIGRVYQRHNLATYAKAVLPLVDDELASVVAENERLRGEVERLHGPFPCCEHCKDDAIHDVEPGQHTVSCQLCDDLITRRAESAEAEVERLRVRLARVEALGIPFLLRELADDRIKANGPVAQMARDKAGALEAVLADAPAYAHVCDSGNFDRTVCPEPCGAMHSYCGSCGERQDHCVHAEGDGRG